VLQPARAKMKPSHCGQSFELEGKKKSTAGSVIRSLALGGGKAKKGTNLRISLQQRGKEPQGGLQWVLRMSQFSPRYKKKADSHQYLLLERFCAPSGFLGRRSLIKRVKNKPKKRMRRNMDWLVGFKGKKLDWCHFTGLSICRIPENEKCESISLTQDRGAEA